MKPTAPSPTDTLKDCKHKPDWCLRDRSTLAGLKAPCSACAAALPRMRELFAWEPEKPGSPYYISTTHLTMEGQREVRKAIADRKHNDAGQLRLPTVRDPRSLALIDDAQLGMHGDVFIEGVDGEIQHFKNAILRPGGLDPATPRGKTGNIHLDEFGLGES